tara:strand:+ start:42 stop:506 length:465 start_codon:yes stop_codon:yes gene_type:complete
MKLKKLHMFLLLLLALILCCGGFSIGVMEGLTIQQNAKERARGEGVNKVGNDGKIVNNIEPTTYTNIELKEIPQDKIPKGDEDLYILKSQIVPPVCPKCPDVKKCDKEKECAPCPAPKRCPDKPFECKMVPKYSDPNVSSHLPRPVLDSFDSFA